MVESAPRIAWPLLEELRRLAGTNRSAAQICREIGGFASSHGLPRPSYQTVRRLVLRERAYRALPTVVDPLVDGWLRARSPRNAVDEAFRRAQRRAAARARIDAERAWRPDVEGVRPEKPHM